MRSHLRLMMLFLSIFFGVAQAAEPKSPYQFAYITGEANSRILHLINPEDTGAGEQIVRLPTENDDLAYNFLVSPDGQWISYLVTRGDGNPNSLKGQLWFMNLLTGEVRDRVFRVNFNDMVWSPNSRYLAIHLNDDEFSPAQFATYIYDIQTDTLSYVLPADAYQYGLTWSPDSSRLAIISSRCSENSCNHQIDVLSMPFYEFTRSFPLDGWGDQICDLNWSPDNRYFSFVFSCGYNSPYISDIFRLDMTNGDIQQRTFFSLPLETLRQLPEPPPLVKNRYDSIWYDSDHLLLGVSAGNFLDGIGYDPATVQVTTNVYHADGTSEQLSDDMLVDFVKNPVDGTIAFRTEKKILQTDESNMPQFVNQEVAVQVAALDGDSLQTLHTTSVNGCDLNWSPDGKYLAYIEYNNEDCGTVFSTRLIEIYFLNQADGSITQFPLPDVYPVPIGWVAVR